jgi:hypothetical protein
MLQRSSEGTGARVALFSGEWAFFPSYSFLSLGIKERLLRRREKNYSILKTLCAVYSLLTKARVCL